MGDFSKRIANLSPEKLDLLARRLAERGGARPAEQAITRRSGGGNRAPLSYAQRRMWVLHEFDPASTAFNIPAAVRLRGRLDVALLERSLAETVRRHESLRTTFEEAEDETVQVIHAPPGWSLPALDFSAMPADERESETRSVVRAEAARAFDLRRGPLLRTTLLRLSPDEHLLLLTIHHIVSDGWSMGVLIREVAALYEGFGRGADSPLEELPLQYADYAAWQCGWLEGEEARRQLDYWRRQLAGMPPVLDLQADHERPAVLSHRGAEQIVKLDDELTRGLKGLARQSGVTLFALTLAAFKVLLMRRTGREDIVVGTNIANRNRGAVRDLIGFFINNLVLRTDLSGNPTFRECLERVRTVTVAAFANQDLPFEMLVEALRPERFGNHTPLFQVMFFHQSNGPLELELHGLHLSLLNIGSSTAVFDLSMTVEEGQTEVYIHLSYDSDLFLPSTVARMLDHYHNLLRSVVVNPGERIGSLCMSTSVENARLLDSFNAALEEAV
jgi:hypothetical protein